MRPTQLPELRQDMLEYLMSREGQETWSLVNGRAGFLGWPANATQCRDALIREVQRWGNGDLFFVTSEMTALAEEAAKTMPTFSLTPSDLPSEHGVIYFDRAIGTSKEADGELGSSAPIVAAAWGPITLAGNTTAGDFQERPYVWLSFYTDTQEAKRSMLANAQRANRQDIVQRWLSPLTYDDEAALPFTVNGMDCPDISAALKTDNQEGWAFTVTAAWLLMQQAVATVTDAPLDRPTRRRLERRGIDDLHAVRVISLRHQPSPGSGDGQRDFHHRWVVKGHWRNQWYPSQKRHVPIWISPHVKGPDGAPLLGGEKVYAWTR